MLVTVLPYFDRPQTSGRLPSFRIIRPGAPPFTRALVSLTQNRSFARPSPLPDFRHSFTPRADCAWRIIVRYRCRKRKGSGPAAFEPIAPYFDRHHLKPARPKHWIARANEASAASA